MALRQLLGAGICLRRLAADQLLPTVAVSLQNLTLNSQQSPSPITASFSTFTSLINATWAADSFRVARLHTSSNPLLAEGDATEPSINPLQQVPAPLGSSTNLMSTPDAVAEPEQKARAILRNVAISPRKLDMFTRVIRGLSLEDALIQCQIHHKKSARIIADVLKSAKANAINNHGMSAEKLAIDQIWVGKGQYAKRVSMHAKGRSGVRHKYHSHLTVVLKEDEMMTSRRRTRIIPMMMERKKFFNMRDGEKRGQDDKWWTWFPKNDHHHSGSAAEPATI